MILAYRPLVASALGGRFRIGRRVRPTADWLDRGSSAFWFWIRHIRRWTWGLWLRVWRSCSWSDTWRNRQLCRGWVFLVCWVSYSGRGWANSDGNRRCADSSCSWRIMNNLLIRIAGIRSHELHHCWYAIPRRSQCSLYLTSRSSTKCGGWIPSNCYSVVQSVKWIGKSVH